MFQGDAVRGAALSENIINILRIREVLHGVGADGVGVKFPIFAVNCSRFPCPLGEYQKSEERQKKDPKNEEKQKAKKNKKNQKKKWENSSGPIYTNPIKNLPKEKLS